jgi:hypothetical protein
MISAAAKVGARTAIRKPFAVTLHAPTVSTKKREEHEEHEEA